MSIDFNKLEDSLRDLPEKIRIQKLIVVEKQKELDEAKLKYNVKFGLELLEAKKPNATEKKNVAVVSCEEESKAIIDAEYNLKKEEAGLKFLEDQFIACRKIVSLEQEIMKSQL